jgi:hypothetical protein
MCIEVLKATKKKMHVKEISAALIARYPADFGREDMEEFARKIGQSISSHIRSSKRNAKISKVPNGKGGSLTGVYRIKQKRKKVSPTKLPRVSTLYTGKAGEYGLLSELLFRGYNASIMTVDEGIDVVASKGNKYFHIQVKTANVNQSGKYQFTIPANSYKSNDASTTFYVLITRRDINNFWRSDYIILSSSDIARFKATEVIKDGKQYTLLVRYEGNKCVLNKDEDVTYYVNNFEPMK